MFAESARLNSGYFSQVVGVIFCLTSPRVPGPPLSRIVLEIIKLTSEMFMCTKLKRTIELLIEVLNICS